MKTTIALIVGTLAYGSLDVLVSAIIVDLGILCNDQNYHCTRTKIIIALPA